MKNQKEDGSDVIFEILLTSKITDVDRLKILSWNGVPQKHRSDVWKILLGYLPANSSRRNATLERKRLEYSGLSSVCLGHISNSVSLSEAERSVFRQIKIDVQRTAPFLPLFRNERVHRSMERLLYTWAYRNPATSYVQGMNDIVAPLFVVFLGGNFDGDDACRWKHLDHVTDEILCEVEADCFFCMTNLLRGMQENFTSDQPGIQKMIQKLDLFVERVDTDLHKHFQESGLNFLHFGFRWMNCFLVRELSISSIIRMWDTYFSEPNGFSDFHIYVCAALLLHLGPNLKTMGHDELFEFLTVRLRNTPSWIINVEVLLSQAHIWKVSFLDSQGHFRSLTSKVAKCEVTSKKMVKSVTPQNDNHDHEFIPTCYMNNIDFLCD